MEKENKKIEEAQEVKEQPKQEQVDITKVSTEKLEATCFRIDQQIKGFQRQYQYILNELQKREQAKQKVD